MSKSEELSRKTRRMIAKNLIVLAVLAIVAFVGVASWFTQHTEAVADGLSIKAIVPDGLEFFIVAPNDSNTVSQGYGAINLWIANYNESHKNDTGFVAKKWHEGELSIDFSDPEFGFMSNLFLCETTSDGYTFKIPKLVQHGEIAYVDTNEAFDDATANEEYMSFDIYFRSKTANDVKMLYTSSLAPTGTPGTDSEEEMKNAVIGAVRLSVYNAGNRKLLWIPDPHVWFDGTYNDGKGKLYVNQTEYPSGRGNVYVNENNAYALYNERTVDHAYYDASGIRTILENGSSNNVIASTETGDDEYKLGSSHSNDIAVCTLDSTNKDEESGFFYNRIRVNLWIEGEDAESRLKFVGGKFNLAMNFDIDN